MNPLWSDLDDVRSDDWFVLLGNGRQALDWRLRAIDSATVSIDLQTFIWDFDEAGSMVHNHILAAADRGVAVRALVDDSLMTGNDEIVRQLDEHPNIEYRIYNPFKRRSDSGLYRTLLNIGDFRRLDHRMHNKAMIVDNRVSIIGGRNIADQYFGMHTRSNFRDMEIIAGGPIVTDVSSGFDKYWNSHWAFPVGDIIQAGAGTAATVDPDLQLQESAESRTDQWREVIQAASGGTARLLIDDPPLKAPSAKSDAPVQLARDLVELIDSAQQDIVLVSAYLIPTTEFEDAVDRAHDRGVPIRILTNSIQSNNHLSAHAAYRKHVYRLVAHGAKLYEVRALAKDRHLYMDSPVDDKQLELHAKIMVIDDDKIFVGSANFDPRSLRLNTEMGLVVISETLNQQLREVLEPDFSPRNAWHVQLREKGGLQWVSDDEVLNYQPAASFAQRIEDWFFSHLPIEGEM